MVRRSIEFLKFGIRGTLLALFTHSQGQLLADTNPQFPEIGLEHLSEASGFLWLGSLIMSECQMRLTGSESAGS